MLSEEWLSTILTSIGDAVIATDTTSIITFVNPVAESLTGWTRAEMLGKPLSDCFRIVNEQTRLTVPSPLERALREGRIVGLANHTVLIRRDGSEVAIDDSAAPIRGESGVFTGAVVVFRDVTEHKRAERAVQELGVRERAAFAAAELERQKLYSVFMQAPVGICMLEGPGHTFVFANPSYRALVGGRDVVGKRLLEALPDIADRGLDAVLDRVVETGEPFFGNEVTFKLLHHAQDEFAVMNFVYSPKRNVEGVIDGVLVSVTDVTEQVLARRRSETLAEQLRRSEERLRLLVESTGTGTWELALDASQQLTTDAQHRKLYDLSDSGPLAFADLLAAVHTTDRALVERSMTARASTVGDGRFVIEHRLHNSARWIEVRGQALPGTPARLIGTAVDISERKRSELALADERDKLETVFQVSPAAMALWSGPDLVFEKVNPQYQAVFPGRDLLHRPLLECVPELADQPFPKLLKQVMETGVPHVGVEVLTRLARASDGQLEDHYFDFLYAQVTDSRGQPHGVYAHAIDVTERVAARQKLEALLTQLQRSEANLLVLAEAIPQQVWTALPDGSLDFVNRRVIQYFGVPEQAVLGSGWQAQIHPEDLARCAEQWGASLSTGADYEVNFRLRRFDGSYRWHLGRATAARNATGQIVKWFGTNTDVDEAKRFRETLENAQVIEQQLRREAEQANRSKDEFLAMLGHELRNPLAPIATALQLMKLRSEEQFSKERTIIERQVDHLTRLVDDLLDVSRITSGKVEINRSLLELASVVANAVEIASPLLEQRGHHLSVDVPARGLVVNADPLRLAQVISNLVSNAAKYTEPGGQIVVNAVREGNEVVLRVHDSGVGIAADMLPRVFDMFSQERQAIDRAAGGLGLGLAIVRSLVSMHGGSVSADSPGRGQGSVFTVRLRAAEGEPLPLLASSSSVIQPRGPRRKLLIVDDNVDAAELLAMHVELLGHETRVAHDGPSALKIVESYVPDLAVLDIGLPVMDGYELARQLRALPGLGRMRLIALTGYGQRSDRQRSLEAGFDAHVVKPLQKSLLEALIADEPQ